MLNKMFQGESLKVFIDVKEGVNNLAELNIEVKGPLVDLLLMAKIMESSKTEIATYEQLILNIIKLNLKDICYVYF